MESKWKWNGKGMENLFSNRLESNLNGMEWNWNGNFTRKEIVAKWNGIGMEINRHPAVEVKFNGMEWKWKGNGMERFQRIVTLRFGLGYGMEWKWNGNETHDYL